MLYEKKYPVFQNKALDYNKLLNEQKKGNLLKKILKFPVIAMIKYDGHYCTISVENGIKTFTSSGGVRYSHDINLDVLPDGEYIAERITGLGKLGASRRGVALVGSIGSKVAKSDNTYKIHNCIQGFRYSKVLINLNAIIPANTRPEWEMICNEAELKAYMKKTVDDGYEGLMLIQPDYIFTNTNSRRIDFCKYKKRPTADLLCIETTKGTGKYIGVIGALVLQDSLGRVINVGSGMSDSDRCKDPREFIGKVLEIEYEQITDTYVQPTFGSTSVGVIIRDKKEVD
ncbi:MAG: hypothetical protein JJW00_09085 [Sulfurimonas sp.]|nr:hypothetical protein [Sulfurimonas sp.]